MATHQFDHLSLVVSDAELSLEGLSRSIQVGSVDMQQGQRVSQVAQHLLQDMYAASQEDEAQMERLRRKLNWAAQLHEVGVAISHSDYHKHGAYILDNADAPGFALPELHRWYGQGQLLVVHAVDV